MGEMFVVRCDDSGKVIKVPSGKTLRSLMVDLDIENSDNVIVGCVNNIPTSLSSVVNRDINLRYITTSDVEGRRVYVRTLVFMLYCACRELYPDSTLEIHFSVGRGFFFTLDEVSSEENVSLILKRHIDNMSTSDYPILRKQIYWEELNEILIKTKLCDKLELIESCNQLYYDIDILKGHYGYQYGVVADRTGIINEFDIAEVKKGYIMMVPEYDNGEPIYDIGKPKLKMYDLFSEYKRWQNLQGIPNLGKLNKAIKSGEADEIIKISEAYQENRLVRIADEIMERYNGGVKIILISGPSSSGKTTFSMKLNIQLKVLGLKPIVIGMDDYFVDRDKTPLDENNEKDYEAVEATNIPLLQEHINALLRGEEIHRPTYNFITGKREYNGNILKMKENSVIIIEGIHALNPVVTSNINRRELYKIYVSALTSISMDYTSYFSTTDNRLMRRIVRDSKYRNRSCEETLNWWSGVRRGEERHIFPYQNEADTMFNTALLYEINVLKTLVEPLLLDVSQSSKSFSEATRLLIILNFLSPIDIDLVPSSSLLREFVGGSSY